MFYCNQEGTSVPAAPAANLGRTSQSSRTLVMQLLISLVFAWQSWLPASAQDLF